MGTFTAARFAAFLALAALAVMLIEGPAAGSITAAGRYAAVRTPGGPIGIVPTAAGTPLR